MLKEKTKKAKVELNIRPKVAIDHLLQAFLETRRGDESVNSDLLNLFCQAVLRSAEVSDSSWADDPIGGLFSQTLNQQTQRFIAICLLRLICANDVCFKANSKFKIGTFKLFDKVFRDDLYRIVNIKTSEQTYLKESKLKDVVPKIESEVTDVISSLNSLETLSNFRQIFMQKINSKLSKAVLWPFLPKSLCTVGLDEVFDSVQEYLDEKTQKVVQVFEKTRLRVGKYCSDAEGYGTNYSLRYLKMLGMKLLELLDQHFGNSPFSKPAKLLVEPSKKKYPLYTKDRNFQINFLVKNEGPGSAFNVKIKVKEITDLSLKDDEIYLGYLEPSSITLEMLARVEKPVQSVLINGILQWTNFDKSVREEEFLFELKGQRSDIDWDSLSKEDPYSLEPVTTERDLVDRREILEQLVAQAQAESMGSSYLFGQKRVGKTSIVKTLEKRLAEAAPNDYLVVYLERGDYVHPDAKCTIEMLGRRLCKEIKEKDRRFDSLEIPVFDSALSPLGEFVDHIVNLAPNYRIVIILDEFDELPVEIYKRESVGDSFFLSLRGISNKKQLAFILVGSEKMEFVINCQGDKLNKFQPIRIDYFDKQVHWSDFQDLIRKPVGKYLEISDDALSFLYDQCAGNPYFAKLICRSLFKIMVERKDSHVTEREMREATDCALNSAASNSFQHFWQDGIRETGDQAEEISIDRRKLLLALAETLRQYGSAKKEQIIEKARHYSLESIVEGELREFERRQIITSEGNNYRCKVLLFEEWLRERGIKQIITTFPEVDTMLARKSKEDEAYVKSQEIIKLVQGWGEYKGKHISADQVRSWLSQFGSYAGQRLMFRILENLTFYTTNLIRTKVKEAHGIVNRGLVQRIEGGIIEEVQGKRVRKGHKIKRSDILVSYLDGPGKSGAEYARLYADENSIYYENVVERSKIDDALEKMQNLQALVFVDDLIGTGDSACGYFESLASECGKILQNKGLEVFLIAVVGFQEAQAKIEGKLHELNLPIKVHICDPLDDSAKCFSDSSIIFPDPTERIKAKEICSKHGIKLVRNAPLGYGDCQANIVFANTCPNNSLPILWKES
ncbi:MAG: AAA family ATPase, partial [Candidatus Hodarchaeota archaeon]